ncbi:MAG: hypothetical protein VX347_03745 [Bacteroidota bacterium]|nr:hypothetical protein [Bacteroidota bacterium]
MKKLLLIFLFFPLIYTCQSKKVESYQEENVVENDTLNIERIKIKTH